MLQTDPLPSSLFLNAMFVNVVVITVVPLFFIFVGSESGRVVEEWQQVDRKT